MGIQFMVLAGLCIAISNLFMRRSIDSGGSSRAYLMVQMSLSVLIMILLNPIRTGAYAWSTPVALFAFSGGLLLAAVMAFLGKSLETGPPGLSVALLSSSSVMPILMLVLLFGARFGFAYTVWNAVGSILVITGICWAGWDLSGITQKGRWLLFVSLTFFANAIYLVFLQWRSLFINFPDAPGLGFHFAPDEASMQWFMPMVFLSAAIVQTILYFQSEKRLPAKAEVSYGFLGSMANGLGAFLMFKATEVSTPLEHAMIFPIFSVVLILGCNLWGKFLYQERVNWRANALCIGGLFIGLIDWHSLFS